MERRENCQVGASSEAYNSIHVSFTKLCFFLRFGISTFLSTPVTGSLMPEDASTLSFVKVR